MGCWDWEDVPFILSYEPGFEEGDGSGGASRKATFLMSFMSPEWFKASFIPFILLLFLLDRFSEPSIISSSICP